MAMFVVGMATNEGATAYLQSMFTAGLNTSAKLGLYKSSFSPGLGTTLVEIEEHECDFSGYIRVACPFTAPASDGAGRIRMLSENVLFTSTGPLTPDSVGGAFLTMEKVGPPVVNQLLNYFHLPIPIGVTVPNQQIGVKVIIGTPTLNGEAIFD